MTIIGKIETIRSKNEWCRLFDEKGEYLFDCPIDAVLRHTIKTGSRFEHQKWSEITAEVELAQTKQALFNLVNYKPRTSGQLRDRLLQKGFPEEAVKQAINYALRFNLINDEEYALNFAKDYRRRTHAAPARIRVELLKRGIAAEIAVEALDKLKAEEEDNGDTQQNEEEDSQARQCFEKALRKFSHKEGEKKKRSIINFMLRQGYSFAQISIFLPHIEEVTLG